MLESEKKLCEILEKKQGDHLDPPLKMLEKKQDGASKKPLKVPETLISWKDTQTREEINKIKKSLHDLSVEDADKKADDLHDEILKLVTEPKKKDQGSEPPR